MQESYEVLTNEKERAKFDALWAGQHSAQAKAGRQNDVEQKEQAAQRQAAREEFARQQHAARAKAEEDARGQRAQAAQRQAAREKEEEARAEQAAALEKAEHDRKEQEKARERRASRERAEREQAANDREARRKVELLFLLAREKEVQAAQRREHREHAVRLKASRDQARGRDAPEQESHLSSRFAKAVERAAWIWEHQKQGARHQGPFAEHFAWERRGLADKEQATRDKEAMAKEAREDQAARGRWASREPGAWERTDPTRGRATLQWARARSSLENIVREKVEQARGRVAREQRERARVSADPDIFARERQGQLRRPWTDIGFRCVLEPLPPTLGTRKSSM